MIFPSFRFLKENEQALVETMTTRHVINGPGVHYIPPMVKVKKRKAISLSSREYVKVKNQINGDVRIEKGPQLLFLEAYDEVDKKQSATVLQSNEYVRILNELNGEIRIESGEKTFILGPHEKIVGSIKEGVHVDEKTAVLIRDIGDGSLKLIEEAQVYIPKVHEEIVEVREKIVLEHHETMIIQTPEGRYRFIEGATDGSFFLQPHESVVALQWSSGIEKNERGLSIQRIDSRPKYMWYNFGIRTKDNVELQLDITFFWQITHVQKMLATTDDAPGDVCSHARSRIIQSISKVTLEEFLENFNSIVKAAILDDGDEFYHDRGTVIHSVEVRSVNCQDDSTQKILQEIIRETTDRLNRLQKQESENEVSLNQMRGEIEREQLKEDLLNVQSEHAKREAQISGQAEALRVQTFFENLGDDMPFENKLNIYMTMKKQESIETISQGNANLYFTPN